MLDVSHEPGFLALDLEAKNQPKFRLLSYFSLVYVSGAPSLIFTRGSSPQILQGIHTGVYPPSTTLVYASLPGAKQDLRLHLPNARPSFSLWKLATGPKFIKYAENKSKSKQNCLPLVSSS